MQGQALRKQASISTLGDWAERLDSARRSPHPGGLDSRVRGNDNFGMVSSNIGKLWLDSRVRGNDNRGRPEAAEPAPAKAGDKGCVTSVIRTYFEKGVPLPLADD